MADLEKKPVNNAKLPELQQYVCPEWGRNLKDVPKYIFKLSNINTPIHKWNLPNIPEGYTVSIKRDDMTGSTLSGNKVRKLEFILAEAVNKNCRHVITCGYVGSNHCRATSLAAREVGLKPHLVLLSEEPISGRIFSKFPLQQLHTPPFWMLNKHDGRIEFAKTSDVKNQHDVAHNGNFLLDVMCGADIYILPAGTSYSTMDSRMDMLACNIKEKTGEDCYVIPAGGSDKVGLFGYIAVFEELLSQNLHEDFDDIVFACGSGGTAAGLAIANFLTGSKLKMHAVAIEHENDRDYFIHHIDTILKENNLSDKVQAVDMLDVIEEYVGGGYGISTDQDLEFLVDVSQQTGIVLDPVFTGKAARGLIGELSKNPQRFKGKRILFLHTGGVFGLFDGKMEKVIKQKANHCVRMLNSTEDI